MFGWLCFFEAWCLECFKWITIPSNIQKIIIGNHSRGLILESSKHLLYFTSFSLSLGRTMNSLAGDEYLTESNSQEGKHVVLHSLGTEKVCVKMLWKT